MTDEKLSKTCQNFFSIKFLLFLFICTSIFTGCGSSKVKNSLTLHEVRRIHLPRGFNPTAAKFGSDGRVITWSAKSQGISQTFEDSAYPIVTANGDKIQLVKQSDSGALLIFRSSGVVDKLELNHALHFIKRIKILSHGLDAGVVVTDSNAWFFQRDSGLLSSTNGITYYNWRLPQDSVGDLIVGAVSGGFVAQEFTHPYRLLRANFLRGRKETSIVWMDGLQLPFRKLSEWRGLLPLDLGRGILLQSFANVVNDHRFLFLVDSTGHVVTSREISQPFAFQDVDTVNHFLLGIRPNGSGSEAFIATYELRSR